MSRFQQVNFFPLSIDGAKFGVVVCTDSKNSTYYPISMFALENGLCTFNDSTELEILEPSYNQLQLMISKSIDDLCNRIKNNIKIDLSPFFSSINQIGHCALIKRKALNVMVTCVHWANVLAKIRYVIGKKIAMMAGKHSIIHRLKYALILFFLQR